MAITAIGNKSDLTRFDSPPDPGTVTSVFVPRAAGIALSGADTNAGQVGPTVFHSGDIGPSTTTTGTDTTPVITETYVCAVRISVDATITGIALLNGSAVAGNITAFLADSTGAILAKSASTAQSGTAAYQKFAFTSAIKVTGPAQYFIGIQCGNVGARFRSHNLGNFPAGKITGGTYGTVVAFTPPTTFTADLGPIADTY